MAFRFDMQRKTLQQQAIVAKKDEENKRKQQEAMEMQEDKTSNQENPPLPLLVIDKDTCPRDDNIIINGQCANCPHYVKFQLYKFGQSCIQCSYILDINRS